jgi:hypothetical protein
MATPTDTSIEATENYTLPYKAPELLYRIQQLVYEGKEGDLKELFKFYGFNENSLKMDKSMENLYEVFEKINNEIPLEKWYIDYWAYQVNTFIAYIKIGDYEQTFQFEYDKTKDEYTVYDSEPKGRARMKLWTCGSSELYSRFHLHIKDCKP